MTDRFKKVLSFTSGREGGFSDDESDDGGRTMWGITQSTYNHWRRSKGLLIRDVAQITRVEAETIYFENYWKAGKCDRLPRPLDLAHFDACVNPGVGGAGRILQSVLHVEIDGAIGNQTLGAVAKWDPFELAEAVIWGRAGYYVNEVLNDPKDAKWQRGWINRCHLLLDAVRMESLEKRR